MPIHQSSLLALQIKTSTVRLGRLDQRSNSQQATNSLQPHARPNRIGILNGWHNSKDWVQSLMAEASPSIKRKNSWPATKSYKIYIHIDHIFIYFLWLKSKENFPAFVTFVDDKISGSVDSRSKTFDDLRHATRCRRSQVSDLGCYIFIHNIYIYIYIHNIIHILLLQGSRNHETTKSTSTSKCCPLCGLLPLFASQGLQQLHWPTQWHWAQFEQNRTKEYKRIQKIMFFHCIWCESVNRTHSTMWLSDFGTSVFPFHPFPCQWLKLLIVVHPLGFLEREFRRHSQVQQWFGQQLSSVVIDRSIDWCITPGVLERPGDFDHGLSADWPNPGVLRKVWILETLQCKMGNTTLQKRGQATSDSNSECTPIQWSMNHYENNQRIKLKSKAFGFQF